MFKRGRASLAQLFMYKQWMWAKDVVSTCFALPDSQSSLRAEEDEISAVGGSPSFVDVPVETGRKRNRREEITQYARRVSARSTLSQNTTRLRDRFEPSTAVVPPEKRRRLNVTSPREDGGVSSFVQSRLLMLHASGEWTRIRDTQICWEGSQRARALTRARGLTVGKPGFTPWHSVFEKVGGLLWQSSLSWSEQGWVSFVRRTCELLEMPQVLQYCVLKDPHPWNPKEKGEELTEEQRKKEDVETSRRLAKIYEDATNFDSSLGGRSTELQGDSQVVIRWLEGRYFTANLGFASKVGEMQNLLYEMSSMYGVRPPELGRNIFKWTYREANTEADQMTWDARNGNCRLWFDTQFFMLVRRGLIEYDSIRGAFDGGRSEQGVGCGWVINVCISSVCASVSSTTGFSVGLRRVACEYCLLPVFHTITSAELTAAYRLLTTGVNECLRLSC